jgi:thiol-disulfide isomerase/thioredoxin
MAQNKKTVFYDSTGQITTYEGHWSQVFTGRYKSVYNKKANTKTLEAATPKEFQAALAKTEKRITSNFRLGEEFPAFEVVDLDGNQFKKSDLIGKVVVVNFWFIGCAPCEAERPSLNELTAMYRANKDVVFIAFARNTKDELEAFIKDHPLHYRIIPTEKDYIKTTFTSNSYPVNIIVDKNGKYFYSSVASGIGIATILHRQIESALRK